METEANKTEDEISEKAFVTADQLDLGNEQSVLGHIGAWQALAELCEREGRTEEAQRASRVADSVRDCVIAEHWAERAEAIRQHYALLTEALGDRAADLCWKAE